MSRLRLNRCGLNLVLGGNGTEVSLVFFEIAFNDVSGCGTSSGELNTSGTILLLLWIEFTNLALNS